MVKTKKKNPYDQKYTGQEYYWGKKPSVICDRIIEIIRPCSDFHPKLLDLGCGEGRNAIYFAKHGFDVTALDVSLPGIEKTKKDAEEVGVGVEVKIIQADIITYEIEDTYDVIFSTGTLQYLPSEVREQRFHRFKESTSPEGINVFKVGRVATATRQFIFCLDGQKIKNFVANYFGFVILFNVKVQI